ncbi:hypothetical protein [Bacillus sp. PS06]|uniref:hypothetical protein n=1 Tax=Bacillus sp. PS06 TaxID=2764176 RepID=UPI001785BE71|nr:hypothetical protein [Bacillus sp. PS06]MBD8069875.1 hypothetical protein [Bacillus sp. PS06]
MINKFKTLHPVIKLIVAVTLFILVGFLVTNIATYFLERQVDEEDIAYAEWYDGTFSEMNDLISEVQSIYDNISSYPDTHIDLTSYRRMKVHLHALSDEMVNYPKPHNRILKEAHKHYVKESIHALQALDGLDEYVDNRQYFSSGPSNFLDNMLKANTYGMKAGGLVYDFRDINNEW